jgi:EAL domain-containing protein (putative c-di-GMP-specific phosphodiesterase class I)
VAGLAVAAVLVADSSGLLRPRLAMILDDSVVRIAAEIGTTAVAEGVETAGQAAALARPGCGFGQGHLYGRPAPMAAVAPPAAALTIRERT